MPPTRAEKPLDARLEVKRCPTCEQRFSHDAAFCPFDGVRLQRTRLPRFDDPLLKTRIDGRYDVVRLLGEGGMGRIYEVRHVHLDRPFAMKVLRYELAREEDLAARFIREATATASVKHPNVVQITDFGRLSDGTPYFVMELLVGHTLGEVMHAGGPIPVGRAVRIIRKIAGALGAAHAAGVVHRDMKPDNVFLVGSTRDIPENDPERGRALAMLADGADVRLVDFGAAKIVGSSRVTRDGVVFGTPHYMSPEQASGKSVDHRADVYSLGVIMYEMFCGRVPFEADTYMGVLTQHMFVEPVPPSRVGELERNVGPLEAIVLKCLTKSPEDRFESMDDLIRAIDKAVPVGSGEDATVAWPPERVSDRPPEPPAVAGYGSVDASDLDEVDGLPRRPNRFWIYLATLAVVATAVAFALARPRSSDATRVVDSAPPPMPVAVDSGQGASVASSPIVPPPVVTTAVPSVASVGEAASARPQAPARNPRPRSTGPLDDVGDPFVASPLGGAPQGHRVP